MLIKISGVILFIWTHCRGYTTVWDIIIYVFIYIIWIYQIFKNITCGTLDHCLKYVQYPKWEYIIFLFLSTAQANFNWIYSYTIYVNMNSYFFQKMLVNYTVILGIKPSARVSVLYLVSLSLYCGHISEDM